MLQTLVFGLVTLAIVALLDMLLVGRRPAFVLQVLVGLVLTLIVGVVGYVIAEMPPPSLVLSLVVSGVLFGSLLLRVYNRAVTHYDERTQL